MKTGVLDRRPVPMSATEGLTSAVVAKYLAIVCGLKSAN